MTWSDFLSFCFLVGFSLMRVLSFLRRACTCAPAVQMASGRLMAGITERAAASPRAAHIFPGSTRPVCCISRVVRAGPVPIDEHSNLIAIFCLAIAIAAGLTGGWNRVPVYVRLLQEPRSTNEPSGITGPKGSNRQGEHLTPSRRTGASRSATWRGRPRRTRMLARRDGPAAGGRVLTLTD